MWLLDHPAERAKMGEYGYKRVVSELSWEHESSKLVSFYKKVLRIEDRRQTLSKVKYEAKPVVSE
jgi:spore maturation protein CgeB